MSLVVKGLAVLRFRHDRIRVYCTILLPRILREKIKVACAGKRKKGEMKGENKDVGVLRSCTLLTKHAEFKTVQGGQIGFQKEGQEKF